MSQQEPQYITVQVQKPSAAGSKLQFTVNGQLHTVTVPTFLPAGASLKVPVPPAAAPPPNAQPATQSLQMTVTVMVPAGAVPGAAIQLKIPDGRQIQVRVPAGKKQGDAFLVQVPAPAQVAAPQPALEPAVAAPLPAPAATTSDPAPTAASLVVPAETEVAAPGAELPPIAAASPIARDATAGDIAGANPANIEVTGEQQFALLSILAGAIGLVVGVVTLMATIDLGDAAGWFSALLLTIAMGSVVGA